MSEWRTARIADFCATGSGGTPSRDKSARYYDGGTIPWVKSGELRELTICSTEELITEAALKETSVKLVPAGALLLAMYGATVGRLGVLGIAATTNQAVCHIVPDPKIAEVPYLFRVLSNETANIIARGVGGAQPNISQGIIKSLVVPLPPLPEQRRIADILDKADALRAQRRTALAELDALTQSIFLDLFGDPATNPLAFPMRRLGDLAAKFSDGPFGSNLKSSHYTEVGVRVIRLQNIGIGEMLNDDHAFISEEHFASLRKHECLPGDVLVGTLGDPNLRACIQPTSLAFALNKADCVQIRPDLGIANAVYICALLNQPATERMAQDKIVGQTRLRISMGRLRELVVPLPSLKLQTDFARHITAIETLKSRHRAALAELDTLFASLQHRAFRGEL